ncbi:MAG: GxxExxY protein [Flavobacteriaceae bacterium]
MSANEKILFKEESFKIIGICMKIHSTMGKGFLESVYSEIIEKEFITNKIPYEREMKLELYYEDTKLNKYFKADFVCYDDIILEIKSVQFLNKVFTKQLFNYLKATNKKLGILINFGEDSLTYKRIINL